MYIFAVYSPKKVSVCEKAVVAGVLVLHIKLSRSLLKTYMYILHTQNPCFLSGLITTFLALLWNACTYMHIAIHTSFTVCWVVQGGTGRWCRD